MNNLAIINVIKFSELERTRIDAEFYLKQYIDVIRQIAKQEHLSLDGICLVTSGTTPQERDKELKNGTLLLKTVNVKNGYVDLSRRKFFINKILDEKLKSSQLQANDILINIVGATLDVIGRTAMIPKDFPKSNITQAMALVRVTNNFFIPEFLFTFFLSKFGKLQISRLARPTNQYNINHEELRSIIVPKISLSKQKIFRDHVSNFFKHRQQTIDLYDKSNYLLLNKLNLLNTKFKSPLSYVTSISKIKNENRLDSEFFQPKYEELLSKLSTFNLKPLSSIATRITQIQHIQYDMFYNYIEIGNVDIEFGDISYSSIKGKELPTNAKIGISGEELIISKVRPTRGAIGIIPRNYQDNFLCSSAFSVYKIPYPLREYVKIVLRSIVGKLQLEKPSKGTSYPVIDDEDVDSIMIPILSNKLMKTIADNVDNAEKTQVNTKRSISSSIDSLEKLVDSF